MDNEKMIWEYLAARIQNAYGVAGLMGNLYAESMLNPRNLQNAFEPILHMSDDEYTRKVDDGSYTNFDNDTAGYGIAQWTYSARKHNLRAYCINAKKSIGDLDAQLGFLWQELQGYTAVLTALKTAKSVREASDEVMLKYERPKDQSEAARAKRAEYGEGYLRKYTQFQPHIAKTGKEFMTAKDLIEKLVDIAKNYETIYMYACYGFKVDSYNIARKSRQNLDGWYSRVNIDALKRVANRTPTWWGFDCVNVLKGVLWGWRGDESMETGGAKYKSNGVPDTSANGMIRYCYDVTTDFKDILPGEGLWMEGHWGTYIGNGLCVECTGRWKNGVQVTAVWNIGKKEGYNGRQWTKHGKLPWIAYDNVIPDIPKEPDVSLPTLRRGSTGKSVVNLQKALIVLAYNIGPDGADGDFGKNTENAVKQFQKDHGLVVDGIVGPKTWVALDKALDNESRVVPITVKSGTWNIRSGPGTNHPSIGIANGGDILKATGKTDNGWIEIRYKDGDAWISQKAIKL